MAASTNLVTPETLKQLKPYMTLATQLEQRGENSVAYYCRLHAMQLGMKINKTAPESKKFLFQLMDSLEAIKLQSKSDEAIQSSIVGQAFVERFALKLFENADNDDRQARFNKNLVKQFYSTGLLFDVLNYFGELSEDLVAKKQYSKRKAMYLNRCLQTGEAPVSGPLVGDDGDFGEEGGNFGAAPHDATAGYSTSGIAAGQIQPHMPHSHEFDNSVSRKPTAGATPASTAAYNYALPAAPQTAQSDTTGLSIEQMQQAQKLCKYAPSALQCDDINTAISNFVCLSLSLLKASK